MIEKQQAIASIRSHLAFFGLPVDSLTDEEIERGVIDVARVVQHAGVTTDQAIRATQAFARMFRAEAGCE